MLITRSVKENMTILCNKFFPNELAALESSLTSPALRSNLDLPRAVTYSRDREDEQVDR